MTTESPEVRAQADLPQRKGRLALVGFGLGVLSFALWFSVGLPAPLVGLLAVLLSWLALRRPRRGGPLPGEMRRLARWGLGLGLVKLAVFLGFLLVVGVTAVSRLGV